MPEKKRATLILEDGTQFQGFSFGDPRPATGEVVFDTAMTGYPESLTDPSFSGQILVFTYPIVGNYGVPPHDVDENGLPKFFESGNIHIRALVVSDYSFDYSHWNAEQSLDQWLREEGIPGIYGVDTRAITKILREKGAMLGKIVVEGEADPGQPESPYKENLIAKTSCREVQTYGNGKHKVVLVDCGTKLNIIRCLLRRNTTVIRVPWDYDFTTLDHDAVLISNGPGNPEMAQKTVENVRKAFESGKPIFGICMGNHILAMAAGASIYKLKYGHRSHNQPALLCGTDKAYVTSQNHGFAVDPTALGEDWKPLFENLNDGTNEGIRHRSKPFFSVQFHPEAASGPVDTEFLFDNLIEEIERCKA